MKSHKNDSAELRLAGPIGAALGALLLLRMPLFRALPRFVLGLAFMLLRPALLVLGIAKIVECVRGRDEVSPS
jgi:hypothetical protein